MRNARLGELQAGIKITRRNINNLRYADDTTLGKEELPHVQARFRKERGTRNQIANIHWIIGKAREFQKNIYLCYIDYAKAFDCVDHNKPWRALKEMETP